MGDQQPPPFPYTRVSVGVVKHTSAAATPEGSAHKTGRRRPEKVGFRKLGILLQM